MDFTGVPEPQRQAMVAIIERKQSDQFVDLFNHVLSECFRDCTTSFTSDILSTSERACLGNCAQKLLKMTNRLGQLMAEKQQLQKPQ